MATMANERNFAHTFTESKNKSIAVTLFLQLHANGILICRLNCATSWVRFNCRLCQSKRNDHSSKEVTMCRGRCEWRHSWAILNLQSGIVTILVHRLNAVIGFYEMEGVRQSSCMFTLFQVRPSDDTFLVFLSPIDRRTDSNGGRSSRW